MARHHSVMQRTVRWLLNILSVISTLAFTGAMVLWFRTRGSYETFAIDRWSPHQQDFSTLQEWNFTASDGQLTFFAAQAESDEPGYLRSGEDERKRPYAIAPYYRRGASVQTTVKPRFGYVRE